MPMPTKALVKDRAAVTTVRATWASAPLHSSATSSTYTVAVRRRGLQASASSSHCSSRRRSSTVACTEPAVMPLVGSTGRAQTSSTVTTRSIRYAPSERRRMASG